MRKNVKTKLIILVSFVWSLTILFNFLQAQDEKGSSIGFNSTVSAIEIQTDEKILVGGNFTSYFDSVTGQGFTRLHPDGKMDRDFVTNSAYYLFESYVSSILVQPDGKIVVAGIFKKGSVDSDELHCLARFNADGTPDKSFPAQPLGFNGIAETMALEKNGSILIGGNFNCEKCGVSTGLVRVNQNGVVDENFVKNIGSGVGKNGTLDTILIQDDGKIILVGGFRKFNGKQVDGLVRLLPDGTIDIDFLLRSSRGFFHGFSLNTQREEEDFGPYLPAAVLEEDGGIIMAGEFMVYGDDEKIFASRLLRFDSDGGLDLEFVKEVSKSPFKNDVNALGLLPDGSIVAGSDQPFSLIQKNGQTNEAFLTSAGAAFIGTIYAIKVQKNGQFLIGGEFPSFKGVQVGNISRISDKGTLDEVFTTINY